MANGDGRPVTAAAQADVLVAGAGHNSLIAAAYLATAGLKVTVLERRERAGGSTMTEELTLPGFWHDNCASAHVLIQSNPLLRDDELELGRHGLRYLFPDPVFTVPFLDGESLTMHRDVGGTAAEIARFSRRDADAYRELLDDWRRMQPVVARDRGRPPVPASRLYAETEQSELGAEFVRIRSLSALDLIRERFEEPHVRAWLAWLSTMTMDQVDRPGTGLQPFSLAAGRQRFSWTTPAGGSSALPDACRRLIEERGGQVLTAHPVQRFLVEDGRVVGIVARDTEFRARCAVLSTIHVQQLPRLLGEAHLGEELPRALKQWREGMTMFVIHLALSEAPLYRRRAGDPRPCVAAGTVESLDNLMALLAAWRQGRVHVDEPVTLLVNSSLVDPSRAPAGCHTYKVVSFFPYDLRDGGPERWDAIKEEVADDLIGRLSRHVVNLRPSIILGRHVESPLDLERFNPNNWRGSCHGGDSSPDQAGIFRPAPSWSGYRTPLPGFYLTGSTTHPGGSVAGMSGRNAARVILEDLGVPWPIQTGGR